MSPELTTYVVTLVGYLAVAGGAFLWIWRSSRRISRVGLRLVVRALVLAFLFAPAGVACGGAAIAPFSFAFATDVVRLFSPNGCGMQSPRNVTSFLLTFLVVSIALYIADRIRHRDDDRSGS